MGRPLAFLVVGAYDELIGLQGRGPGWARRSQWTKQVRAKRLPIGVQLALAA
jgi:hypothetical protein